MNRGVFIIMVAFRLFASWVGTESKIQGRKDKRAIGEVNCGLRLNIAQNDGVAA